MKRILIASNGDWHIDWLLYIDVLIKDGEIVHACDRRTGDGKCWEAHSI